MRRVIQSLFSGEAEAVYTVYVDLEAMALAIDREPYGAEAETVFEGEGATEQELFEAYKEQIARVFAAHGEEGLMDEDNREAAPYGWKAFSKWAREGASVDPKGR